MDQMVFQVQHWLNTTYGNNPQYSPVKEDGITGGTTVAALITALQIEIGVTPADGSFGPATLAACPTLPKTGAPKNEIYILQGALYCKGYNPNGLDGGYGTGVMTAIKKFQSDAGLTTQDGITTPMIFKALLNTDAYTLISGGDPNIRIIQQKLNQNYNSIIGLIPTNGVYSKSTNVALIKALQREEGLTIDGIWGSKTMNACPTIPGSNSTSKFVLLLQFALYCNGYNPNGFDGLYGNGVKTAVTNFQTFADLTADGYAGPQTWASLLVSYGDPNRKGIACDCSTTITSEKAATLVANGYKVVGRYLTGYYAMTFTELKTILDHNLRVIPIFEVGGYHLSYFNYNQGLLDAESAIIAAKNLGLPSDTIIYFAVDFDALDEDVTNNILPYFSGVNNRISELLSKYKVGIYAPRNVCSRVSAAGYSCSSFVCDMSSGFSGNLGYKLPADWAFDQISTVTLGADTGTIVIDNDIYSGKDMGVIYINPSNQWTPTTTLAKIVYDAGFLYDPSQDIIYSRMDPLQRHLGYCEEYDKLAATMYTIIDCEPIYFTYGGKDWMIELWKGQYCLETGAEMGIYNRDHGVTRPEDLIGGTFFDCVSNDELLTMSFILRKNGVELCRRGPEKHWWLTGFKWGEFTNYPSTDLTMDVSITLKDYIMTTEFLSGLRNLGYIDPNANINLYSNSSGSVSWNDYTVNFTFNIPKSAQPQSKIDDFDSDQAHNKKYIDYYNSIKSELGLYSNDPNLIDEAAVNALSTELQEAYNSIVNWLNSIVSTLNGVLNIL